MAKKYCLEYGVLEPQEALKLLKEIGKAKKWSHFEYFFDFFSTWNAANLPIWRGFLYFANDLIPLFQFWY